MAASLAIASTLACLWATALVEAHEIGTTQVTVHVDAADAASPTGRAYSVIVVTDADALVEKLEAMADRPASEPGGANIAARLATLEETFLSITSRLGAGE